MKRGRDIRKVIRQLDKIISNFSEEDYEVAMDKYPNSDRESLLKQAELLRRKVYSDMANFNIYPFKRSMPGVPSSLPEYITDTRKAYVDFKENVEKGVLKNFPAVGYSFLNWQAYRNIFMWLDLDSRKEFIKEFYEEYPEERI